MKKTIPLLCDVDAEKILISSMTIKQQACEDGLRLLHPSDFYDNKTRALFSLITEISQRGLAPDLPLLSATIKDRGMDDSIFEMLLDLVKIPPTVNYMEMINRIQEHSRKRELLNKIELIKENISHPLKSSDGILSDLHSIIQEMNHTPCHNNNLITVAELLNKEFPEPRWIIPGLIPEGRNLLVAPPKYYKSYFALDIITSLSLGVPVLGIETTPQKTLYLALEDNQRRLQIRIKCQNVGDIKRSTNCMLTTEWETGTEGLLKLHNYIQREKPELIAIDTLGVFLRIKDYRDYAETTNILTGLKTLSHENNTSIILVHHTRKTQTARSDDDFLENVLGSQGIAGGVDTILSISRKRQSVDAILSITGRDVPEQELAIRFNTLNCRWELLGKSYEVADSTQRQEILDLLKSEGSLTPVEIADSLSRNRNTIRGLLKKMSDAGNIIKQELSGRYKINEIQ